MFIVLASNQTVSISITKNLVFERIDILIMRSSVIFIGGHDDTLYSFNRNRGAKLIDNWVEIS